MLCLYLIMFQGYHTIMKLVPDASSCFLILKKEKISLVVSALIAGSTITFASPIGGQVTTGSAVINQNGLVTTINQSTNKASINWESFNIGTHETVNFVQPNASSITLNRVIGMTNSLIEGVMNAKGQVFLINPNGVIFAHGSSINVGGLVASTLNITDANFQSGNYIFEGSNQNGILNMGTITANDGGYVSLIGKTVQNEGIIAATLGNVQLAGGDKISLNINGNSLIKLTIDQGTLNALVENKGLIKADGGQVYLSTQSLNAILDGMVNNTGVIEAQTLNDVTGKVVLYAHGGTANIGGTITAKDGFVETSGDKVKIDDHFIIKANEWLIDPVDFIVSATGGDITGTALSNNLTGTSVTIQSSSGNSGTNGDIFINDAVTWNSGKTLTLNAYHNIYINSAITANNSGKVALYYGQGALATGNTATYIINAPINLSAGQNFDTKLGSNGVVTNWTVITDLGNEGSTTRTDLQGISGALAGNFVLGANIDASTTSSWNSGAGFQPLGNNASTPFTGKFDGLGHTISNLAVNQSTFNFDSVFGYTQGSLIRNIGLAFSDELNTLIANRWSAGEWGSYDPFINGWHPSQITFNNGTMTLTLADIGNVLTSGIYLTNQTYHYGSYGIKLRASNTPGTITGFFTYTGPSEGTVHDEIDVEIKGDDPTKMQVNYWTNNVEHPTIINLGFDASATTHTYTFRWNADKIEWYVDGAKIHTETGSRGALPTTPGKIMINVWGSMNAAPWSSDFNSANTPVSIDIDQIQFSTYLTQNTLVANDTTSPTPSTSELTSVPVQHATAVITTIVNSTAVIPPVVPVLVPHEQSQEQNTALIQHIMPYQGEGDTGTYNLVGMTEGAIPLQTVSMEELKKASPNIQEIRIPLSINDNITLVNGGVNLPKGVSQEFYIIEDHNIAKNSSSETK